MSPQISRAKLCAGKTRVKDMERVDRNLGVLSYCFIFSLKRQKLEIPGDTLRWELCIKVKEKLLPLIKNSRTNSIKVCILSRLQFDDPFRLKILIKYC